MALAPATDALETAIHYAEAGVVPTGRTLSEMAKAFHEARASVEKERAAQKKYRDALKEAAA